MNRTVALVAALLLVPIMAGCVGQSADSPDTPAAETTNSSEPDGPGSSEDGSSPARLDIEPARETTWANGSVPLQNTNAGTGQISDSAEQTVPLDDAIPPGVPVRVNVTARWNSTTPDGVDVFDNVDVEIDVPRTAVYDLEGNDNQAVGSEYLAATIGRASDDSIVLVADGQWPNANGDIQYTLRIDVEVDPARLPAGSLVAAPTEAGTPLTVVPANGSDARAFAWGPDDAYLGSVNSSEPVPLPGTESLDGEVVVLLPEGGSIRSAAEGSLTLVDQRVVEGDAHDVPPVGQPVASAAWTFERDAPPVAVGLAAEAADPGGTQTGVVDAEIATDDGTVVQLQSVCTLCIRPPGRFGTAWSSSGAAGDATSFDVTAQATGATNAQVRHLVLTYER